MQGAAKGKATGISGSSRCCRGIKTKGRNAWHHQRGCPTTQRYSYARSSSPVLHCLSNGPVVAWFETLQDLHGWRVQRVTPSVLELVHLTLHLLVTLPLERFQPLLQGLVIEPLPPVKMDEGLKNFPAVLDALVKSATLVRSGSLTTHREVSSIQRILEP